MTILNAIIANPGITSSQLMDEFGEDNPRYGRQRSVSWEIAKLRKWGLIEDCERCPTCNQATTRNRRNVKLYPTGKGIKVGNR